MASHNANGAKATGDKRKRNAADTLTDGASLCCSCAHCSCGCHDSNEAETDSVYLDALPVGYRFDPTDDELITHYLLKKIKNEGLPKNKIGNADIYGNHPKDIVVNYPQAIEGAWYFFTPRNRKYVNGKRPSRKAGFGYWKATGPDHAILANGSKIGGRKSLVYHEGHPPKGTKTDWMMQEYVVAGYQRQRSNLQDMKLDDYVLCKIYTNTKSGKENNEQILNDQQARVDSSDQVMVPYQQMSKQETGPSNVKAADNVGVQYIQNSSQPTYQVDNSFPNRNSNQRTNLTDEVEKGDKEVNPAIFRAENNGDVQDSSVENGVEEAKRRILANDQQTRPTIFQNNVVVQNVQSYQHVGSLYELMTPYPNSVQPIQMTSFPRTRSPLGHDYSLTRYNHSYPLPNPPYFPPTPTKSAPPPPRVANAPHVQMYQGMYWSGPSISPTFQEGYDCDGAELFGNIADMYTQDGNGFFGDVYHLAFDGHEEVYVDEQRKHRAPKNQDSSY